MNTHITLVTTIPNQVVESLQRQNNIILSVVEATPFYIRNLKPPVIDAYNILITYRCPYLIPEGKFRPFSLALNIHPSLLPKYPGLNPWIDMLANEETRGGITIHKLCSIADSGEIIAQEPFDFPIPFDIMSARNKADLIAARLIVSLLKSEKLISSVF